MLNWEEIREHIDSKYSKTILLSSEHKEVKDMFRQLQPIITHVVEKDDCYTVSIVAKDPIHIL